MVKIMENPNKDGWFGGTPIFGNTHLENGLIFCKDTFHEVFCYPENLSALRVKKNTGKSFHSLCQQPES